MMDDMDKLTNTTVTDEPAPKTRKRLKKVTPDLIQKVAELAEGNNLTHEEIGQLTDLERSTITRILQRYNLQSDKIEDYTKHRLMLIKGKQDEVLNYITPEHYKKMSGLQLATFWGILVDKEQAILGNNASNKPVININITTDPRSTSVPISIDITGDTDDNK